MIGGKAHIISFLGGPHAGASVYRPGFYVSRVVGRLSPGRVQEDALPTAFASGADARLCPTEAHDHDACGRVRPFLRRLGYRVLALALSLSLVVGSFFPHYSYSVGFLLPLGLSVAELAPYVLGALGLAAYGIGFVDNQQALSAYEQSNSELYNSWSISQGEGYEWMQQCHDKYTAAGTGELTLSAKDIPTSVYLDVAQTYQDSYSSGSYAYYPVGSSPSFPGFNVDFSHVTYGYAFYAGTASTVGKTFIYGRRESSGYTHDYYATVAPTISFNPSLNSLSFSGGSGFWDVVHTPTGTVQSDSSKSSLSAITATSNNTFSLSPNLTWGNNAPATTTPTWSDIAATNVSSAMGAAAAAFGDALTSFTGTPEAIAPDAKANLGDVDITVATPAELAGDWANAITTPATPDPPVVPDEPIYIPILSDIAQALADILAWLAAAIFNANVLSFADGALTSLVDAFGLSGLFESVVTAVESLPDAISWPWTLDDLQGIGNDVIGGVVGGILAGLGIEGGVTFWDQLSGVLSNGIGVDVLGWGDLVGAVTGIGDDVVDFPGILTGIGNDVIGAINELSDVLTGGITVTLDWTLEALRAALEGLGVNVIGLDLTGVLDAIAALPAEIAAVLGLDWWIEQADHLRPELPDTDLLVLPQATWDEFMAAFEALAVVRVVNGLKGGMLSFFDTLGGGSHGNSQPPRYDIDFSVLGYPVHFTIDFGVFNQTYVLYAHGFMYCLLILWLFGFSERVHRWMSSHIASLLGID